MSGFRYQVLWRTDGYWVVRDMDIDGGLFMKKSTNLIAMTLYAAQLNMEEARNLIQYVKVGKNEGAKRRT